MFINTVTEDFGACKSSVNEEYDRNSESCVHLSKIAILTQFLLAIIFKFTMTTTLLKVVKLTLGHDDSNGEPELILWNSFWIIVIDTDLHSTWKYLLTFPEQFACENINQTMLTLVQNLTVLNS